MVREPEYFVGIAGRAKRGGEALLVPYQGPRHGSAKGGNGSLTRREERA